MALLAEEGDLDLETRNSGESDKPLFSDKRDKRSRLDDKRGSIRSLPWTKSKDSATDKPVKKGKQHSRNKSGSRTPPDSPRALRGDRTARASQASPNVKSNRKSYCPLDDWSDDDETESYTVSNEPALSATPLKSLLPTETDISEIQLSPGRRTTVQFPVLFGESLSPNSTRSSLPLLTDLPSPLREPFPLAPQPSPLSHTQPSSDPLKPASPPLLEEPDWSVSDELRDKCVSQFKQLRGSDGLLLGGKARQFFVLSKLPNQELSAIWLVTVTVCAMCYWCAMLQASS